MLIFPTSLFLPLLKGISNDGLKGKGVSSPPPIPSKPFPPPLPSSEISPYRWIEQFALFFFCSLQSSLYSYDNISSVRASIFAYLLLARKCNDVKRIQVHTSVALLLLVGCNPKMYIFWQIKCRCWMILLLLQWCNCLVLKQACLHKNRKFNKTVLSVFIRGPGKVFILQKRFENPVTLSL